MTDLDNASNVEPSPPAQDVTLATFVEDNHRIISVLGVLTALTVFSRQLPIRVLSEFLSFLFLAATVTLWFELQERFPRKSSSVKLGVFESALGLAVLVLVFYWVLLYRFIWRQMLVAIFYIGLSTLMTRLFQRFDLFNRVFNAQPGHRKSLRRLVYFTVQALIFLVSMGAAGLLGIPVNRWLDATRNQLEQDTTYQHYGEWPPRHQGRPPAHWF